MKTVFGLELAKEAMGIFSFSEFRIVRDLHFYEVTIDDQTTQSIELTLDSEDRAPNYRLHLRFQGVSNLRIDGFGGGETRVIGFDIVDLSDGQLENIAWEVIDFENDAIQFYAMSAEIVSVSKLK